MASRAASRVGGPERDGGRSRRGQAVPAEPAIDVRKTYKLYIGGAFPRSESGRTRTS